MPPRPPLHLPRCIIRDPTHIPHFHPRLYTSATPPVSLRRPSASASSGPRAGRSARGDREVALGRWHADVDQVTGGRSDGLISGGASKFADSNRTSDDGIPLVHAVDIPVHLGRESGSSGAGGGVLKDTDGAVRLLANSGLVIVRQLEMLNVFMGFEQANRYAILDPAGGHVGYIAEEDGGIFKTMSRQALRTHRPFRSVVMDKDGEVVLRINRPFAFINSRIYVHAAEGQANLAGGSSGFAGLAGMAGLGARGGDVKEVDRTLIGEAQQEWHPWRRRYNLFKHSGGNFQQFAKIDSGLWAWDFYLTDAESRVTASINRNFAGFGRELFTDTGQYVVRFDAVEQEIALASDPQAAKTPSLTGSSSGGGDIPSSLVIPPSGAALTLDERAMALATAISIDFDYFSRHSGSGGGMLPFMMFGGGGGDQLDDRSEGQGTGSIGPSDAGGSGLSGPAAGVAGAAMGQGMFGGSAPDVDPEQQDPYEGAASGQTGTVDPYDPYGDVMEDEAPTTGDFDADFDDLF